MSFPDFNASDAHIQWQRFCDLSWYHDDLGVWLDISRMHVNATDLQQLQPRMDKAFAAMQELEAGATANPDDCLLYTSPSPRDATLSRMPSSA